MLGLPDSIRACLFDLDGVLTQTASVHAAAWKEMFDTYLSARAQQTHQPFVPFDSVTDYDAYVDGKPTRLLRANYAFQALEVPGGRHHVGVAYQDRAFCAGAVLSLIGILGCLIGWWLARSKPPTSK